MPPRARQRAASASLYRLSHNTASSYSPDESAYSQQVPRARARASPCPYSLSSSAVFAAVQDFHFARSRFQCVRKESKVYFFAPFPDFFHVHGALGKRGIGDRSVRRGNLFRKAQRAVNERSFRFRQVVGAEKGGNLPFQRPHVRSHAVRQKRSRVRAPQHACGGAKYLSHFHIVSPCARKDHASVMPVSIACPQGRAQTRSAYLTKVAV